MVSIKLSSFDILLLCVHVCFLPTATLTWTLFKIKILNTFAVMILTESSWTIGVGQLMSPIYSSLKKGLSLLTVLDDRCSFIQPALKITWMACSTQDWWVPPTYFLIQWLGWGPKIVFLSRISPGKVNSAGLGTLYWDWLNWTKFAWKVLMKLCFYSCSFWPWFQYLFFSSCGSSEVC